MLKTQLPQASAGRVALAVADAASLPLPNSLFDVSFAGWVFGHATVWNSTAWRSQLASFLAETFRVTRVGGLIAIVETLGTCVDRPAPPSLLLADYYDWLENGHGFQKTVVETSYQFESLDEATNLMEFFFGNELAENVRRRGSSRIPEFTGVWVKRMGH